MEAEGCIDDGEDDEDASVGGCGEGDPLFVLESVPNLWAAATPKLAIAPGFVDNWVMDARLVPGMILAEVPFSIFGFVTGVEPADLDSNMTEDVDGCSIVPMDIDGY